MKVAFYLVVAFVGLLGCSPSAADYRNNARKKLSLRDFQGAIDDYSKAILIDPNYQDDYSNLRDAKNKDFGLSNYADDYSNLGDAMANLKDYKGAISSYTRAIEIYPPSHDNFNKRGTIKFYLQDYIGAVTDYTKSIDINLEWGFADEPINNDVMAFLNRGLAKARLNDLRGAIADYTEVISIQA